MEIHAIHCSLCRAPVPWKATACPRCGASAPTHPPLPTMPGGLATDDLSEEPLDDLRGRAWLVVVGQGASIEIDRPLVLGRSAVSDVVLPAPDVSRRHALVIGHGSTYRVIDLASRTGVYVNGEPISDRRLADGDSIRLGAFTLAFRFASPDG